MTTIKWDNADVSTPGSLYFSAKFKLKNGFASVVDRFNQPDLTEEVESVIKEHPRRLRLVLKSGEEWEVLKLKCKCSDPKKSGRIWEVSPAETP